MNIKEIKAALLNKNIITIAGDVCDDMMRDAGEKLVELYHKGSPDIYVLISSFGGSVECGLDIVDLFNLYKGKKTAIVCHQAYSIAAVILQACDKRLATPYSRILIHNLSKRLSLDTLRDEKKLREAILEAEKLQTQVYNLVAKRIEKHPDVIREEYDKNKSMSVQEALAFGLLDGIWDKPLPD